MGIDGLAQYSFISPYLLRIPLISFSYRPKKSDYRKFKMKGVVGPDDLRRLRACLIPRTVASSRSLALSAIVFPGDSRVFLRFP